MCISLGRNLCANMMAARHRLKSMPVSTIALAALMLSAPALAFDPATDHTCVYNCGGGGGGSGGGYVAPAPRGPSPAELARRRRHAAGIAANKRGAAAIHRKLIGSDFQSRMSELLRNYKEAIRDFEEAARYLPNDVTVHLNLASARGTVASFEGRHAEAVRYYEQALRYSPHNSIVEANLKQEKSVLASSKDPDRIAHDEALQKAQSAEKAQDWNSAVKYRQQVYQLCSSGGRHGCEMEFAFAQYAVGRQAIANNNLDAGIEKLRAVLAYYDKTFSHGIQFESLKQWKTEITTALQIAEAQRRKEQASNPNYPKPPPVYRDADTPRDIPDFKNMPAQHKAHEDNEMGNIWTQKGEWVDAMLSYQRALDDDPDGPFAKVIKENLDRAMKHLKANQPKPATTAAQPTPPKPVQASQAKPQTADSNCTRWSNGSRVCADAGGHHYCEVQSGNSVSRVSCQ